MLGGQPHLLCGWKKARLAWEFPGGKLDGNETVAECAARETFEECGLFVHVDFVGYYEHADKVCMVFMGEPYGGAVCVREPSIHESWQWFPYSGLPMPMVDYAEKALELVANVRSCNFTIGRLALPS